MYDVCVWTRVPLRAMMCDLHCVVLQGLHAVLNDDKWTYCSYDMFKTQRSLFTVQAFVQAQCFWPDKWELMNCLGRSCGERHVDTDLLERGRRY